MEFSTQFLENPHGLSRSTCKSCHQHAGVSKNRGPFGTLMFCQSVSVSVSQSVSVSVSQSVSQSVRLSIYIYLSACFFVCLRCLSRCGLVYFISRDSDLTGGVMFRRDQCVCVCFVLFFLFSFFPVCSSPRTGEFAYIALSA